MQKKKHLYFTTDVAKMFLLEKPNPENLPCDFSIIEEKLFDYMIRLNRRTNTAWSVLEIYQIENQDWDRYSVEHRNFGEVRALLLGHNGLRRLMVYRDAYTKKNEGYIWTQVSVDRPFLGEIE